MRTQDAQEWQFDGLVGPTHNYAGLASGNLASQKHAGSVSNPKEAALQGIHKMRMVQELGIPQAFIPPQKRPIVSVLQQLGFGSGSSHEAVQKTFDLAYREAPDLLAAAFSSSFMWAANAATVSPSADTADGKLHLTPANLISHFHRAMEAGWTTRSLKMIFHNESLFAVHNSLPSTTRLSDEGAANHMRVCSQHGKQGVELFVYGVAEGLVNKPSNFIGRQHKDASAAIARNHGLKNNRIMLIQQQPQAIDAGVFHNDVIAMNTTRLLIAHERAFVDKEKFILDLQRMEIDGFRYIEIPEMDLALPEAVTSYLFNSQLLELPDGQFVILAPGECEESDSAHMVMQRLVEEHKAISTVRYLNLRESMRNGGGPACLRLRVVMTKKEAAAIHPGVVLTEDKAHVLTQWVERHYRDRLALDDLRDPAFHAELDHAYADLEVLLGMPGLYSGL